MTPISIPGMYPENDDEYREVGVASVEANSFTDSEGWSFFHPQESSVRPRVGGTARFYGRGIGFTVRGLFLDGERVFYRSKKEQAEHERKEAEASDARRREAFYGARAALDEKYAALPPEFQRRIDGFRAARDDWRWQFEAYEMTCCVDAVKIARVMTTAAQIQAFYELPHEEQCRLVPDLDTGHSGNTFGQACRLASVYVQQPEVIERMHGALCPLVGCEKYGCWSTRAPQEVA
jgi:hypothetical protein